MAFSRREFFGAVAGGIVGAIVGVTRPHVAVPLARPTPQTVTIVREADGFSRKQVRKILDEINKQLGDGYVVTPA